MDYEERRSYKRSYVELDDNETFLELKLDGTRYQFKPLNTSTGGMGMLVMDEDAKVLKVLDVGNRIQMKYCNPETDLLMTFEIRHITKIENGPFKGHYQVGLGFA